MRHLCAPKIATGQTLPAVALESCGDGGGLVFAHAGPRAEEDAYAADIDYAEHPSVVLFIRPCRGADCHRPPCGGPLDRGKAGSNTSAQRSVRASGASDTTRSARSASQACTPTPVASDVGAGLQREQERPIRRPGGPPRRTRVSTPLISPRVRSPRRWRRRRPTPLWPSGRRGRSPGVDRRRGASGPAVW